MKRMNNTTTGLNIAKNVFHYSEKLNIINNRFIVNFLKLLQRDGQK